MAIKMDFKICLFVVLLSNLNLINCKMNTNFYAKPNQTDASLRNNSEEDFSEFDFFDKSSKERSEVENPDALALSIVKAVRTFTTDKKNSNFNILSLITSGTVPIGNIFGRRNFRKKRNAQSVMETVGSAVKPQEKEAKTVNPFGVEGELTTSDLLGIISTGNGEGLDLTSLLANKDDILDKIQNKLSKQKSDDKIEKKVVKQNDNDGIETKEAVSMIEDAKNNEEEDKFDFDEFLKDDDDDTPKEDKPKKVENADENIKVSGNAFFGFPIGFDEPETSTGDNSNSKSNINKIPKKGGAVLSRQTKSLDDVVLKTVQDKSRETNAHSNMEHKNSNLKSEDDLVHDGSFKERNGTGIEKVLDVYSVQGLIENWRQIKKELTPSCRKEMTEYLQALIDRKLWSLKMDDAGGRYTSGYFWGNGYWSGSAALCEHVTVRPDNQNQDISYNGAHTTIVKTRVQKEYELPGFEPAFYMVKLHLNTSAAIEGPQIIHLGLCLPGTCTLRDVRALVETPHVPAAPSVLNVKAPHHNRYDIFEDRTFQILTAVSAVVLGLVIAGTLYEIALGPRLQQCRHEQTTSAKTIVQSQMQKPSVKMTNGKAIYSLNGISNNNNESEERLNVETASPVEPIQLNLFSELILSFSVISNMRSICDQTVGADTIPTIHGLRSISMAWVILGHTCIVAFKYSDNTELRKVVEKEFLFQTVTNGAFSVDTFFCISGILVSFLYFRTNAKGSLDRLTQGTRGFTSGVLQFIGLLAYRFARLTAPYMFMLGVVEVCSKWFHHNSVFEPPTQDHINCPDYWWRNVLYINTLFPVEQMCMLWSWYLADDSQFYVIGAVILILAASHFKTAASTLTVFLVSSWFTTAYIAWSNNHMPSTDDPLALFDKIYDKPWTRLGPYLVGMAAGWLLFKTNCRMRMSKFVVFLGWLLSTLLLLLLVYGLYEARLSPLAAAAYSSLSHTAWAIGIAWIVVACSTGYGGYINSLLSATILYPFSRVTYCAYLVHPVVIRFLAMHLDHPIHLGKDMMTIIFLGQMVASFILSFIISLAFEAPVVTMLKILAPNRRKKLM